MNEIRANSPQPVTGPTLPPRALPAQSVGDGPLAVGQALQLPPAGLVSDPNPSAPITRLQADIAQAALGEGGAAEAFRGGAEFCLDPREPGTTAPQSRMRLEDLVPGVRAAEPAAPEAAAPQAAAPQTAAPEATAVAPGTGPSADQLARNAGQGIRAAGETGRALDELGRTGGRSLQVPGRALGLVGDLASLPANVEQARRSLAEARATDRREDVERATGDLAAAGSNVLSAGVNATEATRHVVTHRAAGEAARAIQQATPEVPANVRNAASRTAAQQVVIERATPEVAERAAMRSGGEAARTGGRTMAAGVGAPNRAAARALLQEGGEAAARAATGTVARSAVASGARAAGRFVPGANVAIAALDTASAAAAWRDPNASAGRRLTSVVTAAGSIAAATNVPILSQGGAIVSGVSSFFGSFF